MRTCKKCGEDKPLIEFYKHPNCKEGRRPICITCRDISSSKEASHQWRLKNPKKSKAISKIANDRNRMKYPGRVKILNKINSDIRGGRLLREPCEICADSESHAHHDDYDKPLDIRWLCRDHHNDWHKANGPGANLH